MATSTPCASGFRDSAGGSFFAVGGTSASAPTFAAILALVNQYMGNTPPAGLAPVNPTLYRLPGKQPLRRSTMSRSGDNKVPCTSGTTNCPSGTTQSASPQVLATTRSQAWDQSSSALAEVAEALSPFSRFCFSLAPATIPAGTSTITTITTLTPNNGFTGTVNFSSPDADREQAARSVPRTVSGGSGTTTLTHPALRQ